MKNLPIGIQSFKKLRDSDFLYIDKTREIHKLLQDKGQCYFLSRPRRFGKSLLVSTLKEIFSGNRYLFTDLWIYDKIKWEKSQVIMLDFSTISYQTPQELKDSLKRFLDDTAQSHGITLNAEKNYKESLVELIEKLAGGGRVVLLIDEYDKPVLDHGEHPEIALQNRQILKSFYEALKGADEFLEFVFITGVSKFSKVSVFSGLNNLNDISLDARFSSILGFSDKEMQLHFKDEIAGLGEKWNVPAVNLESKIKKWYSGYSWDGKNKLYNPVSVHNFFTKKEFRNFWSSTATPSFLIEKIKEKELSVADFDDIEADNSEFNNYDVDNILVTPLLFQTGYLTIKRVVEHVGEKSYFLSYPNKEVRESFLKHLLRSYTQREFYQDSKLLKKFKNALHANDISGFFSMLKTLFAALPHDAAVKERDDYYQTVIYLVLTLMGICSHTEVETFMESMDAVIETDTHFYIIEYKMDTAESAIQHIKDKKYYQKHTGKGKKVTIIGIGFDSGERNISDFIFEEIQ